MSDARRFIRGAVGLGWLLASQVSYAQSGTWAAFLEGWQREPHAPLSLLTSKGLVTAAYRASDDQIIQMIVGSDLFVDDMDGPFLDQVRTARNWDPGPHWILLDREGKVLDEGRLAPSSATLRHHLAAAGRTPAWESLDRFLEQHPDHGEALQQRMAFALRAARLRLSALRERGLAESVQVSRDSHWPVIIQAKAKNAVAAAGLAREVGETLRKLNQIPDAWRGDWSWFSTWLDWQGPVDPDSFRRELGAFQEGIYEAWRRGPHARGAPRFEDGAGWFGLVEIWMACENLREVRPRYSDIFGLTPSPGRVWPSTDLLRTASVRALMRGQAQELLTFLDGLEAEPRGSDWEEWLTTRQTVCYWRTVALAQLGRWPEAASALQELRRWAGTWWKNMAGVLKSIFGPPSEGGTASPRPGGAPQPFLDLLAQPSPEPPLAPAPKPLRFLVWDRPPRADRWKVLRQASPLGDWGAEELKDEVPTETDTAYLRRAGLPARGWAVFRGTADLIARGEDLPEPRTLALQLASVAPARLQVLDAFIRQHPDHVDARRDRFSLLRSRMPRPEFEDRLMEDARLAGIPLDFGPEADWIRNVEGWRSSARRALPDLEAALRRWPGNAELWRQWMGWSAFLPVPPSALALSESLAVFGSRSEWKAKLPVAVHKAIAAEFLRKRRFDEMADWFLEAWTGVLARTLESRNNPPLEARPQDTVIYESLGAALKPLGRTRELMAVDQAWAKVRKPREEKKP
ncbi:MAG: hypothetical protein U0P46_05060 [Holophagaceae bacterium]